MSDDARAWHGAVHAPAVTGLAACGVVVAFALDSSTVSDGPVVCPFRLVTGLPCPACGSVRAWVAVLDGDVAAGLQHNPFAVLLLVATVVLLASIVVRRTVPDLERVARHPLSVAVVATWVAWGAVRAFGA